jgi:putative DNA primase/helicase
MTKTDAARDWLLELRTVDNEDEFKDIAYVALRANRGMDQQVLALARRHNGDLEQWVVDTVIGIQEEQAEERRAELARVRAGVPKLQPDDDTAAQLDRATRAAPAAPQSDPPPYQDEQGRTWGAPLKRRFGGAEPPMIEGRAEEVAFSRLETQPEAVTQPEVKLEELPTTTEPDADEVVDALLKEIESPLASVPFASEPPTDNPEPELLSPSAPVHNAREYARRALWQDGALTLFSWHRGFWEWRGMAYRPVSDEEMRTPVSVFLDRSWKWDAKGNRRVQFQPTPKQISDVISCLHDHLALPRWADPPMRLDTGERLGSVTVFQNGLVDLYTCAQIEPSPMIWAHNSVGYDWDPNAKCPEWERFLESIFPGDQEAKDCIEELMGLSSTEDLSFQKGSLLVGKTRGGKGTVLEVLTALIGDYAVASLDFHKWTINEFGLMGALRKRALIFPDARLKPPKWFGKTFDPGGLDYKSVDLLLQITAGDRISVPVKNKGPWEGRLPGMVWIAMNHAPNFNDTILPGRFVKIAFEQSFLGREDTRLLPRLKCELPGIAVRTAKALARLRERGRFIQPRSAAGLEVDILKTSDAFSGWVLDTFIPDQKGSVLCGRAFAYFKIWAERGHEDLLTSVTLQNLGGRIRQVPGFHGVGPSFRPNGEQRRWPGLSFR